MTISTTRFGNMEVSDDRFIRIPEGLLGFEPIQEYCLLDHKPGSPFQWLQAVDEPQLAFVVVNPFGFFSDYDIEISDADARQLELNAVEDAMVISLVTISKQEITTNLVGPIVVNRKTGMGKQVVLNNTHYGTRHSLVAVAV